MIQERPDEMVVKVIGRQWSWSFAYPEHEDIVSADLVLPVNQPILLKMTSEDVLHAFWVPEFRVKQDLVPGMETTLRIEPNQTGEFKLRCAEICGLSHSDMLANVSVVTRGEFDAWVEENSDIPIFAELTPEERGEIWYGVENGFACVGCHSVNGNPGAGPTWLGVYGSEEALDDGSSVTVDDAYLRKSILDPNAQVVSGFAANVMPQIYEQSFADKQAEILAAEGVEVDIIEDLIAFMKTLDE
jgi:cytochrome c oxidase subunit 2